MNLSRRTVLTGVAGAVLTASCIRNPNANIDFVLPWVHSAEFAFLYYANNNLLPNGKKLNLIETRGSQDVATNLRDGVASFGLMAADTLMIARVNGAPIRAIAAIYQQTPAVIVSKEQSNITEPEHLIGRSVGVIRRSTVYKQYLSLLRAAAIDPATIEEIDAERGGAAQLERGDFDALTQFSNYAPVTLRAKGIKVNEIPFHEYGINLYGTCVVGTDRAIETEPDFCRLLIEKIREGAAVATNDIDAAVLEVPEETIQIASSPQESRLQLTRTNELMLERLPISHFGSMSLNRWSASQETLVRSGQITAPIDPNYFFDSRFL